MIVDEVARAIAIQAGGPNALPAVSAYEYAYAAGIIGLLILKRY